MEKGSGPALVFYEGCRIRDDRLVLPGGISLRLPHDGDGQPFAVPAGMRWTGAVHIVDVTDLAGRVTRRTGPAHRKHKAHLLCKTRARAPVEPAGVDQAVGVDWGVKRPLVDSDGVAYPKYGTDRQRRANQKRHRQARRLQQSMSGKTRISPASKTTSANAADW